MQSKFEEELKEALKNQSRIHEPLPGHEVRFETRLAKRQAEKKIRQLPRWPVLVLAAACVAALLITLVAKQMAKDEAQIAQARLSDVSYEMSRVEEFYTQRLKTEMPVIDNADDVILRFREEMKRLEQEYLELEKILSKDFSNQHVIDGMVDNYRYRLRIIEMMQRYIEFQNNKNNNDEKTIAS